MFPDDPQTFDEVNRRVIVSSPDINNTSFSEILPSFYAVDFLERAPEAVHGEYYLIDGELIRGTEAIIRVEVDASKKVEGIYLVSPDGAQLQPLRFSKNPLYEELMTSIFEASIVIPESIFSIRISGVSGDGTRFSGRHKGEF